MLINKKSLFSLLLSNKGQNSRYTASGPDILMVQF